MTTSKIEVKRVIIQKTAANLPSHERMPIYIYIIYFKSKCIFKTKSSACFDHNFGSPEILKKKKKTMWPSESMVQWFVWWS